MADREDLFRKVARQLVDAERAGKKKGTWTSKEIEERLLGEAKASGQSLEASGPLDTAKRVMRVQNCYQEIKDRGLDPQFAAAADPTSPISPMLAAKARELGYFPEGEWKYVDPGEIDHAKMACRHPKNGSVEDCPARTIPVRIPFGDDEVDYLLIFCKTCSSGWWSARRPTA